MLAKVDHIDGAERLELINQLLQAEEVSLRDLGRFAVSLSHMHDVRWPKRTGCRFRQRMSLASSLPRPTQRV